MLNFLTRTSSQDTGRINQELYKKNVELAFQNKTLSLLRKLYATTLITLRLDDLALRLVDSIKSELNPTMIGIFLLSDNKKQLVPISCKFSDAVDVTPTEGSFNPCVTPIAISPSNTVQQQVLTEGKVLAVDTLDALWNDPVRKQYLTTLQERSSIRSTILYPLRVDNRPIGVFLLSFDRQYAELSSYEAEALENFSNLIAIAIDKAQTYEQLDVTNKKLKQQNLHQKKLLQMRSEFLDIASHQLKTPVSVILGTLSLFKEGSMDKVTPAEREKFIDNIFRKAKKLGTIINDILRASEMDTDEFKLVPDNIKPTQVETVLSEAAEDLKAEAQEKGLTFEFNKPQAPLPVIMADADFLEQAFYNLIDNALKYTAKGSVRVAVVQADKKIVITFTDSGIGIPADDQKKIFDKFNRAKNAVNMYTDGSGLGLFIVKKIIEAHGGTIGFVSEENKGTTFTVTLPINAKAK